MDEVRLTRQSVGSVEGRPSKGQDAVGATLLRAVCALCILLAGCSRDVAVDIPFVATIHGAQFSCDRDANGFVPFDLRFYVHGLELIDARGATVPVHLTNDGVWQNNDIALLDFET